MASLENLFLFDVWLGRVWGLRFRLPAEGGSLSGGYDFVRRCVLCLIEDDGLDEDSAG